MFDLVRSLRLESLVGTRRQPRTVRFSSDAICSMLALALAASSGSVGRKALPTAYAPCRGSWKSTSLRRKASGICSSIPPPSAIFGSDLTDDYLDCASRTGNGSTNGDTRLGWDRAGYIPARSCCTATSPTPREWHPG